MRIGLEHIDPVIGDALAKQLCATGPQFLAPDIQWSKPPIWAIQRIVDDGAPKRLKRPPTDDEQIARIFHRRRERVFGQRILVTVFAPLAAGLAMYATFALFQMATMGMIAALSMWLRTVSLLAAWNKKRSPKAELQWEIYPEEFRCAAPLIAFTPRDQAYCSLLTRISEMDANQQARREIRRAVAGLKPLMEIGRRLDETAESLGADDEEVLREIDVQREEIVYDLAEAEALLCDVKIAPSAQMTVAAEFIESAVQRAQKEFAEMESSVGQKTGRKKVGKKRVG